MKFWQYNIFSTLSFLSPFFSFNANSKRTFILEPSISKPTLKVAPKLQRKQLMFQFFWFVRLCNEIVVLYMFIKQYIYLLNLYFKNQINSRVLNLIINLIILFFKINKYINIISQLKSKKIYIIFFKVIWILFIAIHLYS